MTALLCLSGCAAPDIAPCDSGAEMIEFRVTREVLNPVDVRLFGQFLERATFGEPGPEAVVDPDTGRLPAEVVVRLKEMRIPVIRFPAGTDVDFVDWRDMIDNVPGRDGGRPVTRRGDGSLTNRFGHDEYFALRDELGCETILVLNLMDAVMKVKPLDEAVSDAVGLLAYANARVGQQLPEGMPDWPAVRARNGRREPFDAEYIQIGNEWRFKGGRIRESTGMEPGPELARWYVQVLRRYIEMIRAIDADVRIIIDGQLAKDMESTILADAYIRKHVYAVTFHVYAPGPALPVRKDRETVDPAALEMQDWWASLSTIPGSARTDGTIEPIRCDGLDLARELGYRIACTEWNWNGWAVQKASPLAAEFSRTYLREAKALGCAAFLQGMMRDGGDLCLATQSMLVGSRWDIAAVHVDPEGARKPFFSPQGFATAFYRRFHGNQRLRVQHETIPGRSNPYTVGKWTRWSDSTPWLADVDLVATASDGSVFVHIVQRHFSEARTLRIDLTDLGIGTTDAALHRMIVSRQRDGDGQFCRIETTAARLTDGIICLELPPRTVSILEIQRNAER
jgi:alpha-N-arabinofuranosidase